MNRRVRLKDIADQTGFSTNTVSLALKYSPLVTGSTREIILEVAKKLNYHPNQLARSLVSRQSHTIGLILTNIENPTLTRAAQQIQTDLSQNHYVTLFATTSRSLEQEKNALSVFQGRQVDGILIYPSHHDELDHIRDVVRQGTPVVLLAGDAESGLQSISFDAREGARLATKHLIEQGHRRIAIMDNAAALSNYEKTQGYEHALAEAGIQITDDLKFDPGGFDANFGYSGMKNVAALKDRPTAVLAANDLMAIGVMHYCRDVGISVPGDLSVIGFDNLQISAHVLPSLTTVGYAAEYLAHEAVVRLLKIIKTKGDLESSHSEFVSPSLVLRGSTSPPR